MRPCCTAQKVVIFAVPGAFTPTCSLKHLPAGGVSYKSIALSAAFSSAQLEPVPVSLPKVFKLSCKGENYSSGVSTAFKFSLSKVLKLS